MAGLRKFAEKYTQTSGAESYVYMELVLHGLVEFDVLNKDVMQSSMSFRDLLANMLDDDIFGDLN